METSSPARVFLNDPSNAPQATAIAFVGTDTGFLPPVPLPVLPPPLASLHRAVKALPAVCRTEAWSEYVDSLPDVTPLISGLDVVHVLRTNLCVGLIAHTLAVVAGLPIPPSLIEAWTLLAARLDRPTPSLLMLENGIYNFTFSPAALAAHPCPTVAELRDPWRQCELLYTPTETSTERHFLTSTFSIELAAAPLPGLVAAAHDAVLSCDTRALHAVIVRMISTVRAMTVAFVSADVRPLSPTYIDHVAFTRVFSIVSTPVVPGEQTASGTLFPSIHLLDVFLSRTSYLSELGKLSQEDRSWLPALHRRFFDAVAKVSVYNFVEGLDDMHERRALSVALHTLQTSFAGECGLMGRHRIRIATFLELGMKVGRVSTVAGASTPRWQNALWKHMNSSMLTAMNERLSRFPHAYLTTTVKESHNLPNSGGRAHTLVLSYPGLSVYRPGDHVAVLAENGPEAVKSTLRALEIDEKTPVCIRSAAWFRALQERAVELQPLKSSEKAGAEGGYIDAEIFLRHASLQPLDGALGRRLADAMYVTGFIMLAYLLEERASSFAIALELIKWVAPISPKHLLAQLDSILQPITDRHYSIASHPAEHPDELRLVLGKLEYSARNKLSFRYDTPPWRQERQGDEVLDVAGSEKYLESFGTQRDASANGCGEQGCHDPGKGAPRANGRENTRPSEQDVNATAAPLEIARISVNDEPEARASPALQKVLDIISQKQKGSVRFNAKSMSRSKAIISEMEKKDVPSLAGVSSNYLMTRRPGDPVLLRLVDAADFAIPADERLPVVMFALGSGISPFRAFIHELKLLKQAGKHRNAWLVLGVRTRNDIPFRELIEDAVCKERLLQLSLVFSREDVEVDDKAGEETLQFRPGKHCRIQQVFEDDNNCRRLWDMVQAGGHLYTCGHPELERALRRIIASCAERFGTSVEERDSAKVFAESLVAQKRLHIDTYFSGVRPQKARYHTHSEIAAHTTPASCWTIFRGSVYDVTSYFNVHPGGGKVLLDKGGRDMTDAFETAHGADNVRVASMLEPYRIGSLKRPGKASLWIVQVLDEWAVPALHDMLETRSAWELTVNEFSGLCEPAEFTDWKSFAHTQGGRREVEASWWRQHEPDLYAVLSGLFAETERGAIAKNFANVTQIGVNLQAVRDELSSHRCRALDRMKNDVPKDMSSAHVMEALQRERRWAESYVEAMRDVVRTVETAIARSSRGLATKDVGTVMLADCVRVILCRVEQFPN